MKYSEYEVEVIINNYLSLQLITMEDLNKTLPESKQNSIDTVRDLLSSGKYKGVWFGEDGYMCFNEELGEHTILDCNNIDKYSLNETVRRALTNILSGKYESESMFRRDSICTSYLDKLKYFADDVLSANKTATVKVLNNSDSTFEELSINFIKETLGDSVWDLLEGSNDKSKAESFLKSR